MTAFRDGLFAAGVNGRPAGRRKLLIAQAGRLGLIHSSTAVERAGVTRQAVSRWGRLKLYGARQIDGEWFFDPDLVPSEPSRARAEPHVTVVCARCQQPAEKKASDVRDAIRRGHRMYHADCWEQVRNERLAVGRKKKRSPEACKRISEARKRTWAADGKRDRDQQADVMANISDALRKSAKRHVDQVKAAIATRGYTPLTPERERDLARRARRRAQTPTARSMRTRELEEAVRELWATDKTQMAIANELHVTPQRVGQIVRGLELRPRPRGRPVGGNVKDLLGAQM